MNNRTTALALAVWWANGANGVLPRDQVLRTADIFLEWLGKE